MFRIENVLKYFSGEKKPDVREPNISPQVEAYLAIQDALRAQSTGEEVDIYKIGESHGLNKTVVDSYIQQILVRENGEAHSHNLTRNLQRQAALRQNYQDRHPSDRFSEKSGYRG